MRLFSSVELLACFGDGRRLTGEEVAVPAETIWPEALACRVDLWRALDVAPAVLVGEPFMIRS